MLEVGRMPEHNAAESRSHLSAWAIVSAPLILGFDLADDAKLSAAWEVISNVEALEISQSWEGSRPFPSGKLLKKWRSKNAPTLAVRGGCGKAGGCEDDSARCAEWAKEQQCDLNPGYMHKNCAKSCGTCAPSGGSQEYSSRVLKRIAY